MLGAVYKRTTFGAMQDVKLPDLAILTGRNENYYIINGHTKKLLLIRNKNFNKYYKLLKEPIYKKLKVVEIDGEYYAMNQYVDDLQKVRPVE